MTDSLDDTQPRKPFEGIPADLRPTIDPEAELAPRRGSCLLTGLIGGVMLLIAVAIVALSAAAGWTSGQREANVHATATQRSAIDEQIARIPSDVASGNTVLLDARVRWLATQTPGVSSVDGFIVTATALYLDTQPTATPQVTATPEATSEIAAATEEIVIETSASGGYDLAAILSQAQAAAASSQWEDAVELLDVIIGIDPNFERTTVRTLMLQSLNNYAHQLYNANQPAQANLIVNRAEEFGALAEGLEYERYAAELFLTARAAVGTGSPRAAAALQAVLDLGPGRYYVEAQGLLYNLYVGRGDLYIAQSDSCSAAIQYQNAVNMSPNGSANGKLAAARAACANATPTTDPNLVIPSDQQIAPVGVVATPGT